MFDLLVLWAWEYDADFIALLQRSAEKAQIHIKCLGPVEAAQVGPQLASGTLQARALLDRVWDEGGDYERHIDVARKCIPHLLNDFDLVRQAWHKPSIHYRLIAHGLHAPHMLVLPSVKEHSTLAVPDLTPLGPRFSIKSVNSGGSGVLKPGTTWQDVLTRRMEWPHEQTLLQRWVEPQIMGAQRAWFRLFYACGSTFVCWQDDLTHEQVPVTPAEEARYGLGILRGMMQQIAGLCGLNLFSTEIALDVQGQWQVIDYVNDPCDYRLKSNVKNGVPDEIVQTICDRIVAWASKLKMANFDFSRL